MSQDDINEMRELHSNPADPVFQLAPPEWHELLTSIYDATEDNKVGIKSFWRIYEHVLDKAERFIESNAVAWINGAQQFVGMALEDMQDGFERPKLRPDDVELVEDIIGAGDGQQAGGFYDEHGRMWLEELEFTDDEAKVAALVK